MLDYLKQASFVGARDLDVAERFYGGVLRLELADARPFALVHETAVTQLRITAVDDVQAAPSPSGARIAWFHDPDGNSLSLQG